jgi:hypothetical protein
LERLWLFGRRRGGRRRRGFRLNIDGHFSGLLGQFRRQRNEEEDGGVERDYD